jgi:hypothetical protein
MHRVRVKYEFEWEETTLSMLDPMRERGILGNS